MKRSARDQQLLKAYEIVANDLDDRNMQKLADHVTKVMSRIAQYTPELVHQQQSQSQPWSGHPENHAAEVGWSNDEINLAKQYLWWGQRQPRQAGLLNTIYQHASQNQSPQFVNRLMTFLKAQGITQ